jgi:hypothetical protein
MLRVLQLLIAENTNHQPTSRRWLLGRLSPRERTRRCQASVCSRSLCRIGGAIAGGKCLLKRLVEVADPHKDTCAVSIGGLRRVRSRSFESIIARARQQSAGAKKS